MLIEVAVEQNAFEEGSVEKSLLELCPLCYNKTRIEIHSIESNPILSKGLLLIGSHVIYGSVCSSVVLFFLSYGAFEHRVKW